MRLEKDKVFDRDAEKARLRADAAEVMVNDQIDKMFAEATKSRNSLRGVDAQTELELKRRIGEQMKEEGSSDVSAVMNEALEKWKEEQQLEAQVVEGIADAAQKQALELTRDAKAVLLKRARESIEDGTSPAEVIKVTDELVHEWAAKQAQRKRQADIDKELDKGGVPRNEERHVLLEDKAISAAAAGKPLDDAVLNVITRWKEGRGRLRSQLEEESQTQLVALKKARVDLGPSPISDEDVMEAAVRVAKGQGQPEVARGLVWDKMLPAVLESCARDEFKLELSSLERGALVQQLRGKADQGTVLEAAQQVLAKQSEVRSTVHEALLGEETRLNAEEWSRQALADLKLNIAADVAKGTKLETALAQRCRDIRMTEAQRAVEREPMSAGLKLSTEEVSALKGIVAKSLEQDAKLELVKEVSRVVSSHKEKRQEVRVALQAETKRLQAREGTDVAEAIAGLEAVIAADYAQGRKLSLALERRVRDALVQMVPSAIRAVDQKRKRKLEEHDIADVEAAASEAVRQGEALEAAVEAAVQVVEAAAKKRVVMQTVWDTDANEVSSAPAELVFDPFGVSGQLAEDASTVEVSPHVHLPPDESNCPT